MKETVFEMTKRRTDALRTYMQEKKIDVSFICSGPGVRYLSGFAGTPGDASLLITPEKAFIFTDSRYTIQAGEQCPYFELRSAAAWDYKAVKEWRGGKITATEAIKRAEMTRTTFYKLVKVEGL